MSHLAIETQRLPPGFRSLAPQTRALNLAEPAAGRSNVLVITLAPLLTSPHGGEGHYPEHILRPMNRRARSTPVASLSIVLPAYNEEANIERAVEQCVATASRLAKQYEVIVVDDGSSDGMRGVVEGLVRHGQNKVRLLSHHTNRGYGAALRTGVTSARYDYVFFMDSDNQFDVSELEYFLPLMDEDEMVTGFRVVRYD